MNRRTMLSMTAAGVAATAAACAKTSAPEQTAPAGLPDFTVLPDADPTGTDALPPFPAPLIARPDTPAAKFPLRLPDPDRIDRSDLTALGVLETIALLRAKAVSSLDLTTALLDRVDRYDPKINSFVRRYADSAREQARQADRRLAAGDAPALCGVPVALKDVYAVAGRPLTAGVPVLANNVARGDSTAWSRMSAAGMPLLGHVHTHQMAIGSLTEQTANPWDPRKVPGGSSGGSAAELAARFTAASFGTDTAGSLRIPASCCNVCSIKPTSGMASVYGTIPVAWTFDNVGPMARSAADLGPLLQLIAGLDPLDPRTAPMVGWRPEFPTAPSREGLSRFRIGVPTPYPGSLDPGVLAGFHAMRDALARNGATIVEFQAPTPTGYTDMLAAQGVEIYEYQRQWWSTDRSGYTRYLRETLEAIEQARIPAVDFFHVQRQRTRQLEAWLTRFRDHELDAVLLPVLGTEIVDRPPYGDYSPPQGMAMTPQINDANYCGLPAVAIPTQPSPVTGLPVGVQFLGAPYRDATLLQVAIDTQQHTDYHRRAPALPS
ncbi:amidase [Nocardia sp. CDC159]|uniref:Amidase n=1 Tax=Nocardia pulmonis TaxID=2951408 RepID=A0A9X2EG62_9NOCA|nr:MULTISPECIES: amidase [Nocardia]MCM6778935.1 amidase [Nocardia pulmonis]MCM6791812.1 amidase [Nocardia sp. CDC159]